MSDNAEKKFKLIGIALFLAAFLISPLVWKELSGHCFIFGLMFFILGLLYYFKVAWVLEKAVQGFQYLERHLGWKMLIGEIAVFVLYLLWNKNLLSYALHAGWGDEPSFVGFDFSSWTSVLGNHRTLGLPVVIKIYQVFFKDFQFFPYLQMICYLLSIIFLYGAFLKFGLNRILAFLAVSFLLWDKPNYSQFQNIQSEAFTAILLNFCVGSTLLAFRKWDWKTVIPLGIFVFWLYQVRPNFAFVPLLIPFWAAGIALIKTSSPGVSIRKIFVRFSLVTILPLMLFCSLRLAVVGQFGVVSMSGGCLSGHAVHYLNEENIKFLSGDVRKLAEEVLFYKRHLTPPNNFSPFDWIKVITEPKKIEMEAMAFGPDLIIAWNVAIKQLKGVEPFDDPKKNIDPMEYSLPLSAFYTKYYNYESDRLLMKFSTAVLTREWKRYIHWMVGGAFYGLNTFMSPRIFFLTLLGFLGFVKLLFLSLAKELDPDRIKKWHQEVLIVTMIGGSIIIFGFMPIVVFNFPFGRLVDLISLWALPVLWCLALPPFWLKQEYPSRDAA